MSAPLLAAEGLTVGYGGRRGRTVLGPLSLRLEPGG